MENGADESTPLGNRLTAMSQQFGHICEIVRQEELQQAKKEQELLRLQTELQAERQRLHQERSETQQERKDLQQERREFMRQTQLLLDGLGTSSLQRRNQQQDSEEQQRDSETTRLQLQGQVGDDIEQNQQMEEQRPRTEHSFDSSQQVNQLEGNRGRSDDVGMLVRIFERETQQALERQLRDKIDQLSREQARLECQLQDLPQRVTELDAEKANLQRQVVTSSQRANQLTQEKINLERQLQESTLQVEALKQERADFESRCRRYETEIGHLTSDKATLDRQFQEASQQARNCAQYKAALEQQLQEAQHEMQNLKLAAGQAFSQVRIHEEHAERLQSQCDDARRMLDACVCRNGRQGQAPPSTAPAPRPAEGLPSCFPPPPGIFTPKAPAMAGASQTAGDRPDDVGVRSAVDPWTVGNDPWKQGVQPQRPPPPRQPRPPEPDPEPREQQEQQLDGPKQPSKSVTFKRPPECHEAPRAPPTGGVQFKTPPTLPIKPPPPSSGSHLSGTEDATPMMKQASPSVKAPPFGGVMPPPASQPPFGVDGSSIVQPELSSAPKSPAAAPSSGPPQKASTPDPIFKAPFKAPFTAPFKAPVAVGATTVKAPPPGVQKAPPNNEPPAPPFKRPPPGFEPMTPKEAPPSAP